MQGITGACLFRTRTPALSTDSIAKQLRARTAAGGALLHRGLPNLPTPDRHIFLNHSGFRRFSRNRAPDSSAARCFRCRTMRSPCFFSLCRRRSKRPALCGRIMGKQESATPNSAATLSESLGLLLGYPGVPRNPRLLAAIQLGLGTGRTRDPNGRWGMGDEARKMP